MVKIKGGGTDGIATFDEEKKVLTELIMLRRCYENVLETGVFIECKLVNVRENARK